MTRPVVYTIEVRLTQRIIIDTTVEELQEKADAVGITRDAFHDAAARLAAPKVDGLIETYVSSLGSGQRLPEYVPDDDRKNAVTLTVDAIVAEAQKAVPA